MKAYNYCLQQTVYGSSRYSVVCRSYVENLIYRFQREIIHTEIVSLLQSKEEYFHPLCSRTAKNKLKVFVEVFMKPSLTFGLFFFLYWSLILV